ncbi:glucokinase [Asticcacaulis endophyticus]|uniref:Glucokinase n=1 Tax=Asticcacaulis endophyticus TaxID=1395890 RepID=A0A918UTJ0_9CAUL|nr:glucokinase [Asticcacaulis endophyticus]GGZ32836.1 glucokinase [Asticcacaulis endophyticus]
MVALVLYVDFSYDNSVRMAVAALGERPPNARLYHCASLDDLDGALHNFLEGVDNPPLTGAAFSICGWERDGVFEMPNHAYRIDRSWIRRRLGVSRLNLVNDCVALSLAIGRLEVSERYLICGRAGDPLQTKAVIAIGRGLGTTAIIADDLGASMPLVLPCAGGFSDLPSTTDREYAVTRQLRGKYGQALRLHAVSTSGLSDVYGALRVLDGHPDIAWEVHYILGLARKGDDIANEAIALVTGWLAATASDMTLSLGAWGGVFLAGSFFDLLGELFDPDAFAVRFTDKGRYLAHLQDTPVHLVKTHQPEMLGLSTLFDL